VAVPNRIGIAEAFTETFTARCPAGSPPLTEGRTDAPEVGGHSQSKQIGVNGKRPRISKHLIKHLNGSKLCELIPHTIDLQWW
jgi:hypothetical protein